MRLLPSLEFLLGFEHLPSETSYSNLAQPSHTVGKLAAFCLLLLLLFLSVYTSYLSTAAHPPSDPLFVSKSWAPLCRVMH